MTMNKKATREALLLDEYRIECDRTIQLAGDYASPARITIGAVAPVGRADERVRLSVTAKRLTMTVREAIALQDTLATATRLATAHCPRPVHVPTDEDD
jgi:hypothetical protein